MDFFRSVIFFIYAALAAPVGMLIGMLASAGQPSVEYVIAGVRVRTRPDGPPARRRPYTAPAGGDPAEPNYFYGPARSDLRYARQMARSRWRSAFNWWKGTVRGLVDPLEGGSVITAPIGMGMAAGLIVALPLAAALVAAVWLAHEIVVDIASVGVRACAATLRAVDSASLSARHIKLRCVACFERIPYPAYLCPNPKCENIHWDTRPGRYGVLHRVCKCGEEMPTVLLRRTARKLRAVCPHRTCKYSLEYRPGETQEIILPVFGAKGAGKTLLLYGILETLCRSSRPGVQVHPADSFTSAWLADLEATLATNSEVPATPAVRPRAYVLRMRIGSRRRIAQFLDAAGELFYDSQRSADLIYLGVANTFVFVIDPLSVSAFWDSLPSVARGPFTPHRSAAPPPELAFQQTADRIAEMGKPRAQRRLAIVFSRADLLGTEYGPGAGDGTEIRRWAIDELGLTGLVNQAESEFKETAYFHTAPLAEKEDNLNALIRWLMRAEGIDPGAVHPPAGLELPLASDTRTFARSRIRLFRKIRQQGLPAPGLSSTRPTAYGIRLA